MTITNPIHFFYQKHAVPIRQPNRLKAFLKPIFKIEGKQLKSLNYIFCSDAEVLNINRSYLGHDYYTDIITFDLSEEPGKIIGEIYISIDRVRSNAVKYKTTIKRELTRVMIHGILHLCGYSDKGSKNQVLMREREDHYLNKFDRSTWNG